MATTVFATIRKLLRLTEARGATPAEAATAAAKIRTLLVAHNLSLADVHDSPPDEAPSVQCTAHALAGPQMSRTGRHLLMHILANHYFCRAIADTTHHRHILIGRPEHVAICVYTHAVISRLAHRLAYTATRASAGGAWDARYYRAYWSGICDAIRTRLEDQRAKMASHAATQAMLVRTDADVQRVAETIAQRPIRSRSVCVGGYVDGHAAGKTMAWDTAIDRAPSSTPPALQEGAHT